MDAPADDRIGPEVFLDQPLEPGNYDGPMALISATVPPNEVVRRLQDIFSLAHVPDADFTGDGGNAGNGTGTPGGSPQRSRKFLGPISELDDNAQLRRHSAEGSA